MPWRPFFWKSWHRNSAGPESFANSQDKLAKLAEDAIAEYKAGRTKPL